MANRTKLTSPKGIAKYPWLNKADTKFDPNGVFRVSLLFEPNEVEDFLARLDELADEAVAEAKEKLEEKGNKLAAKKVQRQDPYVMEMDRETAEETGKVEVKFKMKHFIQTKDGEIELEPKLFDAKGNPVDRDEVKVYGGAILRVNFTPRKYYVAATKKAGVALQMNAVQIIELAERGGDAEFYGFDAVENGGFDATKDAGGDGFSTEEDDNDFDITEEDF